MTMTINQKKVEMIEEVFSIHGNDEEWKDLWNMEAMVYSRLGDKLDLNREDFYHTFMEATDELFPFGLFWIDEECCYGRPEWYADILDFRCAEGMTEGRIINVETIDPLQLEMDLAAAG